MSLLQGITLIGTGFGADSATTEPQAGGQSNTLLTAFIAAGALVGAVLLGNKIVQDTKKFNAHRGGLYG